MFIGRYERTRISPCHQVTIPRDAYVPAGFDVGDKLHATCLGPGRVVLERIERQPGLLELEPAGVGSARDDEPERSDAA